MRQATESRKEILNQTESAAGCPESGNARFQRAAAYVIVTAVIFALTYIMTKKELVPTHSDVRAHMQYALSLDLVMGRDHGGWEFACWLLYAMLPVDITAAACIVTSLFNALTAAAVLWFGFRFLDTHTQGRMRYTVPAAAALAALMVGPLYLRFYNHLYYLGQNTPNPWHNPTYTGVRPFMFIVTLLTIYYWHLTGESGQAAGNGDSKDTETRRVRMNRKTVAMQILLAALLAYSTSVKPSFLTIYLPACVVIVFFRLLANRGRGLIGLVADHLYFIPAGLVLLRQYFMNYGSAEAVEPSGMAIGLFQAAGRYAPSVAFSWFLRMAFPLFVIIFWLGDLMKDELFRLVSLQYIFGQLIAWVFVETGSKATHGNFGWGNMLGTSLIWVYCVMYFAGKILSECREAGGFRKLACGRKLKHLICGGFLTWHLLAGTLYYISLLSSERQL